MLVKENFYMFRLKATIFSYFTINNMPAVHSKSKAKFISQMKESKV